jgi:drug/metabolite transporter (DMT)-like permease
VAAPVTAVLLGLVTALLFGVASYLGPVLSRSNPPSAVLAIGQAAAVAVAAALLLAQDAPSPTVRTLVLGLLAGVANGMALTAMFEAARFLPISVMAPIGATGGGVPVVVALALGERPHILQLVGIPVAMVGVVLVAAGSGGGSLLRSIGSVPSAGLWLAAAWAVFYGVFLSLYAEASAGGGQPWALFSSRVSLLATALGLALARRTSLRLPRRTVPLVALNGLLILAGVATFGWAAAIGPVSVVSVLATLSPVVTVALAVLLLRERLGSRQRMGLVAALVGVALLAAG